MTFNLAGHRVTIDLAHVAFVTAIAGYCGWYLADARAASTDIQNLLLIEPVAVLVFVLYLVLLRQSVVIGPADGEAPPRPQFRKPIARKLGLRIGGSMVLLGLYVFSMSRIGFDVATWLYVLATLVLLGERRPVVLALLPLGFAAVVVYAFSTVLANPLPLAFGSPG